MAVAFVQQVAKNMAGAATSDTANITSTGGNLLVLVYEGGTNGNLSTVTDTAGNTWTVVGVDSNGAGTHVAIAYVVNALAVTSVTINQSSSQKAAYNIEEYSGIAAYKTSAHSNDTTNTTHTTPAVTAALGDLCIAALAVAGVSNTPTLTTGGFTANTNGAAGSGTLGSARNVNTPAGSTTVNWTVGTTGTAGLAIILFSPPSLAFDAASSSGYEAAISNYSWSHTVGTGTNRLLLVGVSTFAAGTVTGITFGGVALTKLRARANGVYRSELWYLVAPASGAGTIAVTLSASLTSIGSAVSYSGVNQLSAFTVSGDAVGTGNPATAALTTLTDNDWVVDVLSTSKVGPTVGAGQTSRANNNGVLGSGAISDKGPVTPAGSATMSWTGIGVTDTWAYIVAALDPSVDAPIYTEPGVDATVQICANDTTETWEQFLHDRLLVGVGT